MKTLLIALSVWWVWLGYEDSHENQGVAADYSIYLYGGTVATAADMETEEPYTPEMRDTP